MVYQLFFDAKVLKTIAKWKKSNPILFRKLGKILEDISQHPRSGIGHPEALVGSNDLIYSRRISAMDRIIYEIRDMEIMVMIIEVEGHYSDK